MIEVENLWKVYGGRDEAPVVAVRDLSFRCEPGRVFGLIGANGAGKTTTLRILSTVLQPSSGRCRVAGHDVVAEAATVRRKIGFLSGSTGVYERMTPVEFIDYFGRLNGMSPADLERRREELLDLLDMRAFADRLCGTLSTGQKQKASIARALIHDPPVLIFDEPTSGLDILVGRTVLDFIETLKGGDRAMILSTHIMSEAEQLCDDIGIIHRGRLRCLGTVEELKERYRTDKIRDLFFRVVDEAETADADEAQAGAVS